MITINRYTIRKSVIEDHVYGNYKYYVTIVVCTKKYVHVSQGALRFKGLIRHHIFKIKIFQLYLNATE